MATNYREFDYIRKLLHDHAAIVLEAGKEYLVDARLTPLARREGCGSLEEFIARLQRERFNGLHQEVVEAMTINETSFFRDVHPFETIKLNLLPELAARRKTEKTLNIWCAASSSGQEVYSLAITVQEAGIPPDWNLHILASDISEAMLLRTRKGRYSQLEVNRGLPDRILVRYFQQVGNEWQVSEELRRMVKTQRVNLAEAWPELPRFDLILLRNVMIYFDTFTKKEILGKVRRVLRPDGYLFLGGAETTLNLDDGFERMQFEKTACFRRRREG